MFLNNGKKVSLEVIWNSCSLVPKIQKSSINYQGHLEREAVLTCDRSPGLERFGSGNPNYRLLLESSLWGSSCPHLAHEAWSQDHPTAPGLVLQGALSSLEAVIPVNCPVAQQVLSLSSHSFTAHRWDMSHVWALRHDGRLVSHAGSAAPFTGTAWSRSLPDVSLLMNG